MTLFNSEPEPDIVVVRGGTRQSLDRHPGSEDIALIIEVSDTTVHRDRTVKKRIYARAGIAIYGMVNLVEGLVEVYSQPPVEVDPSDDSQRLDFGRSAVIPIIIEGIEIGALAQIFLLP
ncbi:Uma2 family endonuclease [Microcoleus sp. K1-B6]|uniref:Uma2 family endonuclease n=1 Tax=unclassified Microcoleus TaxID=2642155 RepID=UPI002FD3616A